MYIVHSIKLTSNVLMNEIQVSQATDPGMAMLSTHE